MVTSITHADESSKSPRRIINIKKPQNDKTQFEHQAGYPD